MAYDVKITNGTLIDGTGAPPRRGDLGVRGGRIVAVGDCPDSAARTLDAEGAIVTPGFVDIHGHYDGQVSWDADLAPSSMHGVTTCVFGSCGVGFAPVRKTDRERLIRLMEGVEDIPGTALAEGLTWNWESFPEYMDAIDGFPHAIDFGVQVPHDALRVYVMGDRAVANEAATDDDIAAMRKAVRQALEAGAVGFSTGRSDNHRSADGDPTPASEATARELEGIAGAYHGLGHGVLQAVSDFDMATGLDRFTPEFDILERMVAAADGHGLSISTMQRDRDREQWRRIIARAEQANAKGLKVRLQVAPRGIGVILGLEATFQPFMGFPSYKAICHLPLAERVARMRDPAFRAKMLTEKSDRVSGDGSAIPPLADELLSLIEFAAIRFYRLGEYPNYEPKLEDSLWHEAKATGRTALEVLYDTLLERDGRQLLYFPIFNYTDFNLDNVREMLTHPLALPGLSDGGAHVGTIC
ncbi:MAG: amidohydrolase family protein, partial [Myxococcales bacterium]|nr:amidohydrolase family protein [Myxococcales bacterium]